MLQHNTITWHGNALALNLGAQVVKKLAELLKGLSVYLFEEPHKDNFTAVDTVMPSWKDLPLALLPKEAKGSEIGSSKFAFKDNLTMFLWLPKCSKHVLQKHWRLDIAM